MYWVAVDVVSVGTSWDAAAPPVSKRTYPSYPSLTEILVTPHHFTKLRLFLLNTCTSDIAYLTFDPLFSDADILQCPQWSTPYLLRVSAKSASAELRRIAWWSVGLLLP